MKTYSELILLDSYLERLDYLKLHDNNATSPRHMSMGFYKSNTWRIVREMIINRDLGFDLGVFGLYIDEAVHVHHINPINENDIIYQTRKLTDPENLITTSTPIKMARICATTAMAKASPISVSCGASCSVSTQRNCWLRIPRR